MRNVQISTAVTDLPKNERRGFFIPKAFEAAQWLAQAGHACWRISPYADPSVCALAADPCGIAPEELIHEGVLTWEEWNSMDFSGEEEAIDEECREDRFILLTMAYERSNIAQDTEYQRFLAENGWWLEEYALFMALDRFFRGQSWQHWPEDIRLRHGYALDYYRRELYFDIEFQMYLQFKCSRQYHTGMGTMEMIGICPL